jgi:hypothetical protein
MSQIVHFAAAAAAKKRKLKILDIKFPFFGVSSVGAALCSYWTLRGCAATSCAGLVGFHKFMKAWCVINDFVTK